VSRVFDALQKTGVQGGISSEPLSPAAFVDALEKNLNLESLLTARMQLGSESRLVASTEPNGPAAERYRLMRLRLHEVRLDANVKTLLITSASPQEGKSTVALNLAAVLAEKRNQSVLLLEGDLRRPSLASMLGLKLPSGLTQCTRSEVGLQSVIWKVEPLGFHLLPAGKSVDNPAELLASEWFSDVTAKLVDSFDWIIIDSPPAIPVADALSLKRCADASLIVARADRTQQSAISETIRILGADHVLGIILNGIERLDRGYYDYYDYYPSGRSAAK
jgi:polysaccharide biosynthesis transport protein